jgi:protein-L-isoaspartate O-methyltransferase
VLGRFLVAGNVKDTPLGEILDSARWREILAAIPPQNACVTCSQPIATTATHPGSCELNWKPYADRLASEVTHAVSRWRPVVATVPRHVFVPRWWAWSASGAGFYADTWELREGPADPDGWLDTAYSDRSLITRVGPLHADYAAPGQQATGRPTSSAALPGLVVQMAQHACINDGMDILDVGTGSGYGCALLTARLGDHHVTSVDVDDYLTKAAADRLDTIGLHPGVIACDATGRLPGAYDRIMSTVAVRQSRLAGWRLCGPADA